MVITFVQDLMQASIGNYILVRPLGEGGMGTVYLAQHYHLQYYAVVKSLHPHYAQNEALRQRFFTEAQVMAQLSHPAIVRLYDFVIHEGVPYLIMEYVQGTPLDEVIATRGALSPEEGYLILSPIWEALHYLHSQKIIHRDIKPSNIMVLPEGGAKLIDFGIAKALDSDYKLTQTGMQVGTVLYMAPEQIQGNPVSFQIDLYAMGLVTYETLFGRFPWDWQGKTQFQLYQMLLSEAPPIPTWTPKPWKTFFDKALAKNPSDRYPSALEMKKAFEALILNSGAHSPAPTYQESTQPSPESPPETPLTPSPTPPPSNSNLPTPSTTPKKASPILIPLLLILLVIGAGGLIAFIRHRHRKHRQELYSQISVLLSSYNAANEAPLKKDITRLIQKNFPGASISELNLLPEINLPDLTDKELESFEQGETIRIYGDISAYAQFSYQQIQEEVEDRECSYYEIGFFRREIRYGYQRWAYQVIMPYRCEAHITIPCTWRLQRNGLVERIVDRDNLTYSKECTPQSPYRGREWPISHCE